MDKFTNFTGIIAPLNRANIDTDAIIPKQFLKSIDRTGFGDNLFDEWRYQGEALAGRPRERNMDFILNNPPYDKASILLAGENFGCGSSREHAVWALRDFGFKVAIAPSFAEIFYSNAYKNGLLPICLAADAIDALFTASTMHKGLTATVNLAEQFVAVTNGSRYPFNIEDSVKQRLLEGLDDIDLILQHADKIRRYEKDKMTTTPWLFQDLITDNQS